MSNLLIVESHNDKYFIEALINHINLDIGIHPPACSIDEYECLGGMGKLAETLKSLPIAKDNIKKVGIIFDADDVGVTTRREEIQKKIDEIFEGNPPVAFSIHILNIDGKGELETLLKSIKANNAHFADCLDTWRECLPDGSEITDKEFDKFWIQIYERYDGCTKRERKQAGKNCNNKASMRKGIYNLDSEHLNDLKVFLKDL